MIKVHKEKILITIYFLLFLIPLIIVANFWIKYPGMLAYIVFNPLVRPPDKAENYINFVYGAFYIGAALGILIETSVIFLVLAIKRCTRPN
jgi:hypothetical protein